MKTTLRRKKAVITPLRSDMFCDDDSVCYIEEFFLEFLVSSETERTLRQAVPGDDARFYRSPRL